MKRIIKDPTYNVYSQGGNAERAGKEITKDKLIQDLSTAIRRFAKRQRTWFRRMEKRGVKINWIEYNDYEALENIVISHINES